MGDQVPEGRYSPVPMWIVAVVLVIAGVLLARLVRAALAPALRQDPPQFELHLV